MTALNGSTTPKVLVNGFAANLGTNLSHPILPFGDEWQPTLPFNHTQTRSEYHGHD
jgi:hypothetical protein